MLCPICKGKTTPYVVNNLSLFHCRSCQLIFQPPQKKVFFNEKNWGKEDPRWSRETYEMKKQTFRYLLKSLKKILPKNGKALDVGTGTGAFLEIAREFKLQVMGLEPDKKFAKEAKNRLNIVSSTLDKADLKSKYFDFISFFDVLEHLPNPSEALKKTFQLLKPDGLVLISTPSLGSLSFKLMGPSWFHFKKEHLFYFSPKSLKRLLETNGFKIIEEKPLLKVLNLDYVRGHLEAFPRPAITPSVNFVGKIAPNSLLHLPFKISNGNVLVVAKKNAQ